MPNVMPHVSGRDRELDLDERCDAAALRPAQRSRLSRAKTRLWPWPVRRVHGDRRLVRSCQLPVAVVSDGKITKLKGHGGPEVPHPVQVAFIAEQAGQCSYCSTGMIMTMHQRHLVTPPARATSVARDADRRRDPAPIHTSRKRWPAISATRPEAPPILCHQRYFAPLGHKILSPPSRACRHTLEARQIGGSSRNSRLNEYLYSEILNARWRAPSLL